MRLSFRNWLEGQTLGGGISPPPQSPVDPEPAPGQSTGAFWDWSKKKLPPTKRTPENAWEKMKTKKSKV
jgi:hypothetical protein